jgi:hypothetical protein
MVHANGTDALRYHRSEAHRLAQSRTLECPNDCEGLVFHSELTVLAICQRAVIDVKPLYQRACTKQVKHTVYH